ncbi:sensor histidine kinase [Paraglaciecola psychrophila]|uniref:Sensor histidine kinase n=1 Tax=Paraglaciecola psychrophila 170 TaxID=1129794 RepID=K6YZF9_9ALTE|nr:sensor histidine kinase [Paraglaciecola psychrophila 170]GAC38154.1 two-component system, sensor histidine kinase YesM [Paraglaciecola psychrophila 170]
MILTLFLYVGFMHIWHKPFIYRATAGFIMVLVVSLIWTLFRIEAFIRLTDIITEWSEFGGWHFASVFIFLCWTGLFHGMRYNDLLQTEHRIMLKAEAEAREEQMKRMHAQTIARDAQIKMLRYQLNPHFLCNTLNAISSLVEVNESEKAQSMTVQLSRFLRHSLDNNPDTKLSLENEVKALNLYLEIEKTRFGDRLSLDFQIDEKAKLAMVPSLLLQPIIENSMKHAIAQNELGGTISIQAKVVQQRLIMQLSDTGSGSKIGKSKMESSKGRGVGLRNINERLKVLYENDFSVNIDLLPLGGLRTTIEIPCEYSTTGSGYPIINQERLSENEYKV